jgi:hypothetical protein
MHIVFLAALLMTGPVLDMDVSKVGTRTSVSRSTLKLDPPLTAYPLPSSGYITVEPELCEVDDASGDLELCSAQREQKTAQEAAKKEEADKKACRVKGCRVFRINDCVGGVCFTVYRTRDWSCKCDWKVPEKPVEDVCPQGCFWWSERGCYQTTCSWCTSIKPCQDTSVVPLLKGK